MIKTALVSVHDKSGIVAFVKQLRALHVEILSTGGTAGLLESEGIPVTRVERVTGFPEMLDGRVKTLHPHIHAALLARRDHADDMATLSKHGIRPLDMVVIGLYPFQQTVDRPDCRPDDAIEMIDIGGPCMLRAAAKNHRDVVVVPGLDWGERVLQELKSSGDVSAETRRALAAATFGLTAAYDAAVGGYLSTSSAPELPKSLERVWRRSRMTRYGENPHQIGAVYQDATRAVEPNLLFAPDGSQALLGPDEVSFNNFQDAHAALELCRTLNLAFAGKSVAVGIKHTNPCGAGVADDPLEAHRRAYLGDPQAALGGVWAQNRRVTPALAEAVMHSLDRWGRDAGAAAFFLEVWIAPQFDAAAVELIRRAKPWGRRVRLFAVGDLDQPRNPTTLQCRDVTGGALVQTRDPCDVSGDTWRVATRRPPSDQQRSDLALAWGVAMHTTSNAVSVCRDGMLIGNGAGQVSRVMSCRIATWLAQAHGHGERLQGAVAASDAFFPFRDGPDLLIAAGIRALAQPGGSKRDADTIAACDEHEVAMLFTDRRHFRH